MCSKCIGLWDIHVICNELAAKAKNKLVWHMRLKNIYFHIMWRFISLLWSIAFPLKSTAICVWKHWNTNYMYVQHCIRYIHVFMFINVNLFEISVGIKSGSRGDFMVKMSLNVNLMLLAFIPTKKTRFHRLHQLYFRWTHTPKNSQQKLTT